jgi:cobalamin biosynthetic protein CobC
MSEIHGFCRHGGRLTAAKAAFPLAPQPWIDLSTGINPRPWRARRARSAELARLPDPEAVRALEAQAAEAFGLEDASRIVAVAGAEAGLRLLPLLTGAKDVVVLGPTYGGHAEAWATAGARVRAGSRVETATLDAEAVVVVNPNNPDGAAMAPDALLTLAERQAARGGWLVVDESFVETTPELSVAPLAGGSLVVLRSFGKFYGLAGVRLGFVLGGPALVERLRRTVGDWPLSADALAAGEAYGHPMWAQGTRAWLDRRAARLDQLLRRAGLTVLGGTSLFRLAGAPDAAALFARLAARGVLVRPFADQPGWLRFGLPPAGGWSRLEAALEVGS